MKEDAIDVERVSTEHGPMLVERSDGGDEDVENSDDDKVDGCGNGFDPRHNNNGEGTESGEDGSDDIVELNVEEGEGHEDGVAVGEDVVRSLQEALTKIGRQRQRYLGRWQVLDGKGDKSTCWNTECTNESGLKTRKCLRCKTARHCGEGCQQAMWPWHRSECKKLEKMKKIEKEIKGVKKRIELIAENQARSKKRRQLEANGSK